MTQKLKLKFPPKADPPVAEKYINRITRQMFATVLAWIKNIRPKNISRIFLSRRFGAVAVLIIFLVANFFQGAIETQGAQFTFAQTDWSGGVTANDAVHPTNETGWTQYSAGTNVVTNVAGQTTIAETTHENFSETFTATTYKDEANTTANWNTSGGQAEMAAELGGVNLYEKLSGILAGSAIQSQIKAGDDYYIGSDNGKFFKYSSVTDTATDLTAKISSFWSTNAIYSFAFDSANGVIYLGGFSSKFARYNISSYTGGGTYPTADTAYDLSAKLTGFANRVLSMVFDSANNVLYLGMRSGNFALYNTTSYTGGGTYPTANTAYDLKAKVTAFLGTDNVNALAFDSANNAVYLGGGFGGQLIRYNTVVYTAGGTYPDADTGYNLTTKISSFWSSSIFSFSLDSSNNVLYLGGVSGQLARYNTTLNNGLDATYPNADTGYSLTAKISVAPISWSTNDVKFLALDSSNNALYLGGAGGKFARYNTTSYAGAGTYPTADTAYLLSAKISGAPVSWSTNAINALAFDSTNNIVYLGGVSGRFARYNTTSYAAGGAYPTADTAYSLSTKVNGIDWNGNSVNVLVAASGNELYFGGAAAKFGKYNTATGVATDLSAKLSGAPISWSTNAVYSLAFDSASNAVYVGGQNGKFARYNTSSYSGGGTYPTADTAYNLTDKLSASFNGNYVYALSFDSANKVLYAGGLGGKFARYNTATYTAAGTYPTADTVYDLTAKISGAPVSWGTNAVYALTFDSANSVVYLGGRTGKFGRYNTTFNNGSDATYPAADTAFDITAKISAFWNSSDIFTNSLSFDSVNKVVYVGGYGGELARYNTTYWAGSGTCAATGAGYAADTACNLTAKTSSFWNGGAVYALLFDNSNGVAYIGGASGRFARYSTASDLATNLRSPDLLSFWSTNDVNALAMNSDGKLYIGGSSGYFSEKPASPSITYAVSSTLDAAEYNIAYATLTKNDTVGTGSITYQLSNNGGSTWETFTPTVNKTFTSTGSDLRFKIAVTGNATVQDVSIAYWAYNPTATLTSSKYNAGDPANVMAKMAWSETLPAGTDVKFQIRTSADGSSWTAWCGPDDGVPGSCSSATYFTDPAGTETVDDINNDHTDDQWYQYKAYLSTSDGVSTPTLSDATVTYVVNAPPQIQNLTASQGADGLVTVDYEVLDPDTNTGVTQNTVAITLQYCTANCGTGSPTWTDAVTATGDGAGISVAQGSWTAHQIVWTPTADYNGQYNATDFKIRVKAYDGELANHTVYATSDHFDLDTSKPTLQNTTLLINDSSSAVTSESPSLTLKLQNLAGDSATETVYAQFSTDGATWYGANGDSTLAAAGSWGTGFALNNIASLSWPWTMAARSETITVRIKDGYGNLQTTNDTDSAQYNAYPELQTISASQGADGLVTVDYEVKDADTATGATPNEINITLQYCTANCSDAGNETWTAAATATGDGAGVSVSGTGWTAHQIVWTAKTDYAGQYNATDFKVRVKADDGSPVNNLDYLESSIFDLDTADPVAAGVIFDHSNNLIVIPAPSEDSNFEIYVSDSLATLFNVGSKTSPLLDQSSSYPNNYTYVTSNADPTPVLVGVKDAKGNTGYADLMTPSKPTNLVYYDISNPGNNPVNGEYREFLAWNVIAEPAGGFANYKVYRSTSENGTYELIDPVTAVISDRLTNYYLDKVKDNDPLTTDSDPTFDPLSPTTYYYKVVSTDSDGNISTFSATVNDAPDGQGGSDTTAPTITNVQVSSIDTTSAVVTWDTDEMADSLVGYSTDHSYTPQRGFNTYAMANHSVTLTGLLPNTTYNINIQSQDVSGKIGSACYDPLDENKTIDCSPGSNVVGNFSFTTDPGPAISNVAVSSNNTQATVSWVTTTDSDTYVVYSDTVTNGALVAPEEVGTPTRVGGGSLYNHSQTLTTFNSLPLVSGETYYFYVKSTDATSQTAIDNNGGNFYSFTTTQDDDDPVMSVPSAVIINSTKAAINWTTDEAATSVVDYGTVSGVYTETSEVLTFDKSHYVIINPLEANTTYYYTVTSADINGNSATSIEYSFTSLMNPEQQHLPLAALTGTIDSTEYDLTDPDSADVFEPAVLTDVSAVIDFETDQIAMCDIQYRVDGQAYNPTDFLIEETGYNTDHSMHIMNLILSTKYYYKIECVDNLPDGQAGAVNSTEFSFTTLEQQYGSSEVAEMIGGDAVAPTVSGVSVEAVSGESETITWTTDELASSYVNYGIVSGTYTDMAGDPLVNYATEADPKAEYATAHTVIINGLTPNVKYYFQAVSHDKAGNIGISSESSFTTAASSSLSSINISSAALGEALITWTTSEKTSSVVEYGLTNLYGQKKEDTTASTAHSLSINGLAAAQLYHIRVSGEDAAGQLYSSGDYTFIPKSPPKIAAVNVKDITEHEATVSFSTDFPTDYTITYTSVSGDDSGSKGKPDFAINHEITLDKLKPGTTYALKIKASDEQGNSVEQVAQNFTTGKDEKAPEITKARTESALAQSEKVQTIISWETNELSTCALIYREGAGGEEKEYKVNDRAALSHVAVVTSFKPGTVYYFKIKSLDEAGNESVSSEYALLTPQKKENIVQIIVNNFQDIFSWVDKV